MTENAAPRFATCDLCDVHKNDASGSFRVLPPVFRDFGAVRRFCGRVVTMKCFEDNTLVKAAVDSPGEGRVLVVDGGGSLRRALVGDVLAGDGAKNGWAGIVVNGAVRDTAVLATLDIGIKALGSIPMRGVKRGEGVVDTPVAFGGLVFVPGDMLYADEDGVAVLAAD